MIRKLLKLARLTSYRLTPSAAPSRNAPIFARCRNVAQRGMARLNPFREAPGKRQQDQFRFHSKLAGLGMPLVEDPLFDCEVRRSQDSTTPSFRAHLVYRGLRVKGFAPREQIVELLVDGTPIRRDRIRAATDGGPFWLYVNRPALAGFPPSCELSVRASDPESGKIIGEDTFALRIPHGSGEIVRFVEEHGPIDKKGNLPLTPEEIVDRQQALLQLYARVSRVFEEVAGRPLFILYGTLLGLHRDGDFIPGDDDFDVGFVSEHQDPSAVKDEAKDIMKGLVGRGISITLNRKGKPFRVHEGTGDPALHLDACPVWFQDGHVWTNPFGWLPIEFGGFRETRAASLRGVDVTVPVGTEAFLEAYYGEGWRIPDSEYTLSRPLPEAVKRNLLAICLEPSEVGRLVASLETETFNDGQAGRLRSKALQDLYPLEQYEAVCGWD